MLAGLDAVILCRPRSFLLLLWLRATFPVLVCRREVESSGVERRVPPSDPPAYLLISPSSRSDPATELPGSPPPTESAGSVSARRCLLPPPRALRSRRQKVNLPIITCLPCFCLSRHRYTKRCAGHKKRVGWRPPDTGVTLGSDRRPAEKPPQTHKKRRPGQSPASSSLSGDWRQTGQGAVW